MEIQLKELLDLVKPKTEDNPLTVGKNYFIRTVTMYYTGRVVQIVGQWIVLEEATWICDTGRFHDFLKDGKCSEYESFIDLVHIPIGSIVDVTEWKHPLFKGQK